MGPVAPLSLVRIEAILAEHDVEGSRSLAEAVSRYLELLLKWNRKINLTALSNPTDILVQHFAESFWAARALSEGAEALLDIGSGAGFPGLALKIFRPAMLVYLVEPRVKRAAFLSTVRRELGLKRVEVLNKRVESCVLSDFSIPPAAITLRALGSPQKIIRSAMRFLAVNGRLIVFTTESQKNHILDQLAGIEWEPPLSIPWSREKLLLIGRRPSAPQNVPRETISES